MPPKGSGTGLQLNHDGYLRIVRRGPLCWKMAHRAYVERQLGRSLRPDEEVHHLCRNRACWPPTDYHLLICPAVMHHAIDGVQRAYRRKRKGSQ
jgi:hypothetical protein